MSGFSAATHANLVEAWFVKSWYILLSGFNKNVFVTVRNNCQYNVAKFSLDFLQKLLNTVGKCVTWMLLFVSNCDAHAGHSDFALHEALNTTKLNL